MPIASSSRKAGELSPEERRTVEGLLGRKLEEDETVSIRASKGLVLKEAPSGEARKAAFRRFIERVDDTAKRPIDVSESEIEAAIDEAITQVRRNRG